MESKIGVSESLRATGLAQFANGCCRHNVHLMCENTDLRGTLQVSALLAAQGVRRSSRRNDVCGCRLASALAGTGESGSAAPGAIEEALLALEMLADGAAAGDVETLDAALGVAADVSADRSNGKVKTARTGAFSPSASMASREATDTNTYPGASSAPTAKGRAGFPSTAISAAPWPTLLAITPDKTNLSTGPGPGPAIAAGVAPKSRDKVTGFDTSLTAAVRRNSDWGGLLAAITAWVQYQPDSATNAHTKAVAVCQPNAFFILNIENPSSHSDAATRKSLNGIASSRPTPSRAYRAAVHGFTLIELMVVLVIIGVLAALIVPNVLDRADDARVMAARTDVNNLSQALKLYKLDNQRLPSTEQGLQALIVRPAAAPVPANWKAYLDKLPNDPWGRPYQYLNPGVKGEVDVMSLGADGQPGGEGRNADVGSWQ